MKDIFEPIVPERFQRKDISAIIVLEEYLKNIFAPIVSDTFHYKDILALILFEAFQKKSFMHESYREYFKKKYFCANYNWNITEDISTPIVSKTFHKVDILL